MNKFRNSKVAKITSGFVGVMTAVMMIGGVAVLPASAATVEELLAMIADLTAQLNALKGTSSAPASVSGYVFTKDLKQGSTGDDVMKLQQYLNSDPDTKVAASGAGSPGNETKTFGPATKAAVIKFQNKYKAEVLTPVGLSAGTGYFGAASRKFVNDKLAASGSTTGGATTGGATTGGTTVPAGSATLTVTAAADQPVAQLLPTNAANVAFLKLTFTAGSSDVTVNSMKVKKTGSGDKASLSGVILIDQDGTQIGTEKTLNALDEAVLNDSFTVKAGTSRTITVGGNRISGTSPSYAGQVLGLSVVSVDAGSATLVGDVAKAMGPLHTINETLSIGSITPTVGPSDPNSNPAQNIGKKDYLFQSIRLTAGSAEKVWVKSVRWNQTGSVAKTDIENIKTYVDGKAYDSTVSSDGKYYTTVFPDKGILVDKGGNLDLTLKGDIIGGSGRNVKFDVNKRTDVVVVGDTFGYGITPANGSGTAANGTSEFTSGTPWFDGLQVSVNAGTITTISSSPSVPAGNISENVSEQTLGGFDIEVKGEPITVNNLVFRALITTTGSAVGTNLDSVSLVNKTTGAVVAGPVDATGAAQTATITFTDTVTLPVGKSTYFLKGKLATASAWENNDTIQASTTPSSDWTGTIRGLVTGDTISLSSLSTAVTMNTMTVKSGANTVTVSATPAAQNVVMGVNDFTFARYVFDGSQSGEDVRYSSIQLRPTTTTGASYPNNCFVYDEATGTRLNNSAVDASTDTAQTFTLDNALIVPAGQTKIIALKCNIPKSLTADDTIAWGVNTSDTITGTGVNSSASLASTHATAAGQTMTLKSSGTLSVSLDSSSPGYYMAADGSVAQTVAQLKFTGTNEDMTLERVALQLTNYASSSGADLMKVTLWDGSTEVGQAVFTSTAVGSSLTTGFHATSTLSKTVIVPKDGEKILTVKVDLSGIGTSLAGVQGHLVAIDYDNNDPTGTRAVGKSSGSTINRTSSSDTASNGLRMFSAYPTVAKLSAGTTLAGGSERELYKWSVKANGGDVSLWNFTFRIATSSTPVNTSSTTVTNLKVIAYDDTGARLTYGSSNGQLNATLTDTVGAGTTDIAFTFNHASGPSGTANDRVTVPNGKTYSFALLGDVTITGAQTSGQIDTKLQSDDAYPSLSTFMAVASDVNSDSNNDFIWSPNATTTSQATHVDWTNGYRVPGLEDIASHILSK